MYGSSIHSHVATAVDDAAYVWSVYSDVDLNFGLYDVAIDSYEPGSTFCSPESIMVSDKNFSWNLMCQWEWLSYHDAVTVNGIY